MEFTAIIDAKARHDTGCAVVGVFEDGELGGAARRIDAQLNGMIHKLKGDGDFSAKLGDILLLPAPAGAAAARVLLIGLGTRAAFGRKQYRKALQSAAQALAKTGASDAILYLTLEEIAELDANYRARIVAEVFCVQAYKIPDLKTAAKSKARSLSRVSVAMADARKNANDHTILWLQIHQAWLHLNAQDFTGALAICQSAIARLSDRTPRTAPAAQLRRALIISGLALVALGDYARALEYFSTAANEMERQTVYLGGRHRRCIGEYRTGPSAPKPQPCDDYAAGEFIAGTRAAAPDFPLRPRCYPRSQPGCVAVNRARLSF